MSEYALNSDSSSNNTENNVLTIKTVQIAPFRTLMTALKDILLETNITFQPDGIRIINMDKSSFDVSVETNNQQVKMISSLLTTFRKRRLPVYWLQFHVNNTNHASINSTCANTSYFSRNGTFLPSMNIPEDIAPTSVDECKQTFRLPRATDFSCFSQLTVLTGYHCIF